jgi:hypothetical protein
MVRVEDPIDRSAKPTPALVPQSLASSTYGTTSQLLLPNLAQRLFGGGRGSEDLLLNTLATQRPGAQNDAVDFMRTNLMYDWQARLNLLEASRNHHQQYQQEQGNTIFPAHNTADPSYLSAIGGKSKVSSVLLKSARSRGEQPPSKKARLDGYALVDRILPLSVGELKAGFPAPPVFGSARSPEIRDMTCLKKIWANFERLSDAMDDTKADQDAFVKELFTRALYRYESDHLCKKVQA